MKRGGLQTTGGGGFIPEICFFLAIIGSMVLGLFSLFQPRKKEE